MLYNNWVIQNFRLATDFDYVNIIFFRNVVFKIMTCGCSTIFPKRMYRSSVTLLKSNLHIQRKRQLSVTKMKINYKTHPMDENSVVLNILLHCPSILEENLDSLNGMMNSKDPFMDGYCTEATSVDKHL